MSGILPKSFVAFEKDLNSAKLQDEENCPKKTVERFIHGVLQEIPNPEYVQWLEERKDHWLNLSIEQRHKKSRIVDGLKQMLEEQASHEWPNTRLIQRVHPYNLHTYVEHCTPDESYKLDLEQIIGEIKNLIEMWGTEND